MTKLIFVVSRTVCRKHELLQYELEAVAQDLTSKKQQCEELATGVSLVTPPTPPPRFTKI